MMDIIMMDFGDGLVVVEVGTSLLGSSLLNVYGSRSNGKGGDRGLPPLLLSVPILLSLKFFGSGKLIFVAKDFLCLPPRRRRIKLETARLLLVFFEGPDARVHCSSNGLSQLRKCLNFSTESD